MKTMCKVYNLYIGCWLLQGSRQIPRWRYVPQKLILYAEASSRQEGVVVSCFPYYTSPLHSIPLFHQWPLLVTTFPPFYTRVICGNKFLELAHSFLLFPPTRSFSYSQSSTNTRVLNFLMKRVSSAYLNSLDFGWLVLSKHRYTFKTSKFVSFLFFSSHSFSC